MKVILLVAGMGKRLFPYTEKVPKCMVELNSKPLLDYQLDVFRRCGVSDKDIFMVTGYLRDKLLPYGFKDFFNEKYESTNMVYSLFRALDNIVNEDIIVVYGDIIYNDSVFKKTASFEGDLGVVVDKDWDRLWNIRMENPILDVETLKITEGLISEIGKKPSSLSEVEGQYIGMFKISKGFLQTFKDSYFKLRSEEDNSFIFENMYMTDFLSYFIDKSNNLSPVCINGGWLEVDTVEDLNNYKNSMYLESIL